MTISLENAVVYDIEVLPNVFTLSMELLNSTASSVWEISEFRDDRYYLIEWFNYLHRTQTPMVGFNNLHYDYRVIHEIMKNPNLNNDQIYQISQNIINSKDQFGGQIWPDHRFAPQIDLLKIHHFDNPAKRTSLKALQINMRSETVVDSPVKWNVRLGHNEVGGILIPYNQHDVKETKQFAKYSMPAIDFRMALVDQFGVEVLNYNDSKIGSQILEKRLGPEICYDTSSGRKVKRQTPRHRIALADVIFPYVQFNHPEFQRILEWMKQQVLTPEDLEDESAKIRTKGVFKNAIAHVGGLDFYFGTGGIHASVSPQRIISTPRKKIKDIDVAALYPSIAIVNGCAPEHLGARFTEEYARLPEDRRRYQKEFGKKSIPANSMKLASNGTYGNSNNPHSIYYDPKFTMTITINGQLMLCMLAERLAAVPTLQLIQANTDGITFCIDPYFEPMADAICAEWEKATALVLESVIYNRMFIRDVNNYVAEDLDGNLKQKGAYWHPDPERYAESISEAQPPAWHKDLGNLVSIKAAVAAMVHGIEPEKFIRAHTDPFDFMCRVKVNRDVTLTLGGREIQRTSRYYVALNGYDLKKVSPPAKGMTLGNFKKKQGVTEHEYTKIMATLPPNTWDERIHTKNKSVYEMTESQIEAGWKICECNDARNFDFNNVNYYWYVAEAKKLII